MLTFFCTEDVGEEISFNIYFEQSYFESFSLKSLHLPSHIFVGMFLSMQKHSNSSKIINIKLKLNIKDIYFHTVVSSDQQCIIMDYYYFLFKMNHFQLLSILENLENSSLCVLSNTKFKFLPFCINLSFSKNGNLHYECINISVFSRKLYFVILLVLVYNRCCRCLFCHYSLKTVLSPLRGKTFAPIKSWYFWKKILLYTVGICDKYGA